MLDPAILTESVTISLTEQPLAAELDGEFVILNAQTGKYYTLEGVGAFIWRALQTPKTVKELRDALLATYDVTPKRGEKDLYDLLETLRGAGLVSFSE